MKHINSLMSLYLVFFAVSAMAQSSDIGVGIKSGVSLIWSTGLPNPNIYTSASSAKIDGTPAFTLGGEYNICLGNRMLLGIAGNYASLNRKLSLHSRDMNYTTAFFNFGYLLYRDTYWSVIPYCGVGEYGISVTDHFKTFQERLFAGPSSVTHITSGKVFSVGAKFKNRNFLSKAFNLNKYGLSAMRIGVGAEAMYLGRSNSWKTSSVNSGYHPTSSSRSTMYSVAVTVGWDFPYTQ